MSGFSIGLNELCTSVSSKSSNKVFRLDRCPGWVGRRSICPVYGNFSILLVQLELTLPGSFRVTLKFYHNEFILFQSFYWCVSSWDMSLSIEVLSFSCIWRCWRLVWGLSDNLGKLLVDFIVVLKSLLISLCDLLSLLVLLLILSISISGWEGVMSLRHWFLSLFGFCLFWHFKFQKA